MPNDSPKSSNGLKSEVDQIENHSFESVKKKPTP